MTKYKQCKICQTYRAKNASASKSASKRDSTLTLSQSSYIDALDTGQHWSATDLKYMFINAADTSGGTVEDGYSEELRNWTSTQKTNMRIALNNWQHASVFEFTETTTKSDADIKFYMIDDSSYPYLGHAYFPESTYKGQCYISYNNATNTDFTAGSYDFITMIHEFGHTLGLAHPHDTGGSSDVFDGVSNSSDTGTNEQNQTIYTVMSYNDLNGPLTPDNVQSWGFPQTPMAYDILAIQDIYGKPTNKNNSNTVYTLPDGNSEGTTYVGIFDTGGTDTISAEGSSTAVTINLNDATGDGNANTGGGQISKVDGIDGGFTIANDVVIENAIGGSGNDTITGNSSKNILKGEDGNDTFYASKGKDKMIGGSGTDTAVFEGKRSNYKIIKVIKRNGRQIWKVKGIGSMKKKVGVTKLIKIEKIKFSSKTYTLADISVNKTVNKKR